MKKIVEKSLSTKQKALAKKKLTVNLRQEANNQLRHRLENRLLMLIAIYSKRFLPSLQLRFG